MCCCTACVCDDVYACVWVLMYVCDLVVMCCVMSHGMLFRMCRACVCLCAFVECPRMLCVCVTCDDVCCFMCLCVCVSV